MSEMKDFHVTIRVRNNQLVERREELGFSQEMFAAACGISIGMYGRYECLRENPLDYYERWKAVALSIANFLEEDPETLWPEVVLLVKNPVALKRVAPEDLGLLIGQYTELAALPPSSLLEEKERGELVAHVLETLTLNEGLVLQMRYGLAGFGEHSASSIARVLRLPETQVHDLYEGALKRLRHSSVSKHLATVR